MTNVIKDDKLSNMKKKQKYVCVSWFTYKVTHEKQIYALKVQVKII